MIYGVDVAKDELVVGQLGNKPVHRLENKAAAIRCWLRPLPKACVVAMESTGRYHRLLAQLAFEAGMRVYVLNARNVHFYAKGLGMRSKTDRVDTGVIARYVSEHQDKLHPWRPEQCCPAERRN
jgi:transposase